MVPIISFFVEGQPRPQPRPKAYARKMGENYVARVYTPDTFVAVWKAAVKNSARKATRGIATITDPVFVFIVFVMPRPQDHFRSNGAIKDSAPVIFHHAKPDGDNLYKGTIDALEAVGAIANDSLVVRHDVWKIYGPKPGALITISPPVLTGLNAAILDLSYGTRNETSSLGL